MCIWDSLGTTGERVEVVDHRPDWTNAFRSESNRILSTCGGVLLSVEHIGSTAVPSLAAKPCLDIMLGLRQVQDGALLIEPMARLGYKSLGEHGIPGRSYFVLFHKGRCVVHAHGFVVGNPDWQRHLFLRDYLRRNRRASREYEELKKSLALQHANDKYGYTNAKTDFIKAIEAKMPKQGV